MFLQLPQNLTQSHENLVGTEPISASMYETNRISFFAQVHLMNHPIPNSSHAEKIQCKDWDVLINTRFNGNHGNFSEKPLTVRLEFLKKLFSLFIAKH